MHELNLITFFKASFSIDVAEEGTDILWEVVCSIRKWLTDKYDNDNNHNDFVPKALSLWSHLKNGGSLYSNENTQTKTVYAQSITHKSSLTQTKYWACKITESRKPDFDFASREWITDMGYKETSAGGHLDLVIKFCDRAGFIGHYEQTPDITVPRVIRLIFQNRKLRCHSNGIPLYAYPVELNMGDGVKLRDIIFNPIRDLPVIYISARKNDRKWTDIGDLLLSPEDVAKCIMGNAFVFFSHSLEFAEELDYVIGRDYGCRMGAARVYFPKIDKEKQGDDPKRHRLISVSKIEEWGKDQILAIFRKAFAQNSDFFRDIFDYDACTSLINRENLQELVKEKIVNIRNSSHEEIENIKSFSKEQEDKIFNLALEESEKNQQLLLKNESLENENLTLLSEVDELKQKQYNLQSQLCEMTHRSQGGLMDNNIQKLLRRMASMPSTCEDVLKIIEAAFPDRIVFTARAYESLEDCVTTPKVLWDILYKMATEYYDLLKSNPANAGQEFHKNNGYQYARGAGSQTRKDGSLMKNYLDEYDGQQINIETHFKKGNKDTDPSSIRVYFALNPKITDRIIVGHCGGHIDNWTTRKVH